MNTYKTKDGQDYTIPGVGRTQDGIIETEQIIENPNFELQGGPAPSPVDPAPSDIETETINDNGVTN